MASTNREWAPISWLMHQGWRHPWKPLPVGISGLGVGWVGEGKGDQEEEWEAELWLEYKMN